MLDENNYGYLNFDEDGISYGFWHCELNHIESISIYPIRRKTKEVYGNIFFQLIRIINKLSGLAIFSIIWKVFGFWIFDILGYSDTLFIKLHDWCMTIKLKEGITLKTDIGMESCISVRASRKEPLEKVKNYVDNYFAGNEQLWGGSVRL